MNWFGVSTGIALLLFPAMELSAAPPFEIDGLHVHLGFEEAVSRAEELGCVCQLGTMHRGEVVTAQCEYAACDGGHPDTSCPGLAQGSRPFAVVVQPVVRIGLEAAAGGSRLTRVSFVYDGDSQVVKESLVNSFGPPVSDKSDYAEKTWTHGRRMQWRSGQDSMGLLMTSGAITLTSSAPGSDGDSATRD